MAAGYECDRLTALSTQEQTPALREPALVLLSSVLNDNTGITCDLCGDANFKVRVMTFVMILLLICVVSSHVDLCLHCFCFRVLRGRAITVLYVQMSTCAPTASENHPCVPLTSTKTPISFMS